MADDERRAKRSRFDQTEPDQRRQSRFDRRSRSPTSRQSESTRHRSPLGREVRSPGAEAPKSASPHDPAAAAAAAAAKINAQLQAKKGIQHIDVPPIRSTASPAANDSEGAAKLEKEVYIADGDYIRDIEVNDLRNRYTLTKGSTQKMIKDETGADVTTRGSYYPDKSMATAANPPLYLHITSTSRDGLEKAIARIEELMKQELPNLVDERRFRRREPEAVERDEFGRRKWPEERIPVDLEPIQGFNLRAQVVGQGGAYVKHIQQKTGCKVQIKGRGSGFREMSTDRESDEPMYLHVAGPDPNQVQSAKELCEDLLSNVREQYQRFKENPPQHGYGGYGQRGDRHYSGGYGGGHGGGHGGGGHGGGYGGYNQHNQQSPPSASMSPAGQGAPGESAPGAANSDYAAQYAQYYGGGADPYAAYGGYQNYVAYYQYYQQWAQQQQGATATDGSAPPPPPPSNDAPPPPPPGAGSGSPPPPPPPGGSYNSVPPPPGL
ncbi:uncharacterized protein TRUGW13939_03392 [Talaromyces rugulosus]|uniref:K Homology domain-containing protein n=1 Tax=Talaromyces rugulosus TaxID=121627 RepID=A0A7H8QS49_TALRU|nr:uncharacterized protein TRUGW13939_03392 [Talaromyces rugulosus]QKX56291.1 hypothetical protein TRUGW13939_03392 [Talaromyces rugulosus]